MLNILADIYQLIALIVNQGINIMIDLLDIKLKLEHIPFGNPRIINYVKNNATKIKHLSAKSYVNNVPITVTSLKNGSEIWIRGCPLKPYQGHNIYGTNQVTKLGYKLITDVLDELGIKVSGTQLKAWKQGKFDIDEIHLTHRFPLKSGVRIIQIVSHIHKYSSIALKPAIIKLGIGVELTAPHKLATWMFYDKCQEFLDKRMKEHSFLEVHVGDDANSASDLLAKVAAKSIRAELKLGKKYLNDNNLNQANCWTIDKVKEVYLHELSLLNLGSIPAIQQISTIYAQIDNPKLRSVVVLWANGEDLSKYYAKTSYEKYRRLIRDQLSIDIKFDLPINEPAELKLSEIFDFNAILAGFPKSLERYPELTFR